jgi:hypothetical protein
VHAAWERVGVRAFALTIFFDFVCGRRVHNREQ